MWWTRCGADEARKKTKRETIANEQTDRKFKRVRTVIVRLHRRLAKVKGNFVAWGSKSARDNAKLIYANEGNSSKTSIALPPETRAFLTFVDQTGTQKEMILEPTDYRDVVRFVSDRSSPLI
jgi:hypothetical protein